MRMRVGLKHLLNDPVSLIYTPVIFSLICMHFKHLYWLPPRLRISCCSIIIHEGLMIIYNLGWVGARHLYLNFDDPRLLVSISGYPRFLTQFFYMTLGSQDQGHSENDLGFYY